MNANITSSKQFVNAVLEIARDEGYSVKTNGDGRKQIYFKHKNLHTGHLEGMFPGILKLEEWRG